MIDACLTRAKRATAGRVLRAVFDEDDPARVRALYRAACGVISSLSADAGRIMEGAEADALAYLDFPEAHRRRIRTNNVQERRDREIKRRARVVQSWAVGARDRARPGADRGAGLEGALEDRGALRA